MSESRDYYISKMHRSNLPQTVITGGGVGVGASFVTLNGSLDALPKSFIASMKTLFDIMDDQRTGFVKLSDIERGWQDDGCKGLPHGVIENLRKVTPASGLLSFERFCAGLKICLLRNQSEFVCSVGGGGGCGRSRKLSSTDNNSNNIVKISTSKPPRPPSAPLLDIENPIPNSQWTSNNTAAVRPNNAMPAQRTLSLPQLSPDSDIDMMSDTMVPDIYAPPPKPPRSAIVTANNAIDKAEIRHALQNWQMGVLMNEMDLKDKRKSYPVNKLARGTADGGSVDINSQQSSSQQSPNSLFQKKTNVKRREPRRHTLQNGIDYNMLKRLKQFEEEKDVLFQGLSAVEKAREWYLKQISNVQEKIKYIGQMGSHLEQWSEAQQERLDLQRARVVEVNRHLSALANSWERGGFPLHMNLAVHHGKSNQQITTQSGGGTGPATGDTVNRLKQQNRQLTDEVGQKSERITALEREKQTLIRDLIQLQRSRSLAAAGGLSGIVGVTINNTNALNDADAVF